MCTTLTRSTQLPAAQYRPAPGCSLADGFPEIAAEWDTEANGDLTPFMLRPKSGRVVYWRCANGHQYTYRVAKRTDDGRGCPQCSSRNATGTTSLAALRPDLAAQWHPTKNERTPHEVTCGSKRVVWWCCAEDPSHEWEASPLNRSRPGGGRTTGCPFCAGKRVTSETSLLGQCPEIAREWHPTRNLSSADQISIGSSKPAWWLCDQGHEFSARVHDRVGVLTRDGSRRGSGCPYCTGNLRWTAFVLQRWVAAHDEDLGSSRAAWTAEMQAEGLSFTTSSVRPIVDAFFRKDLSVADLRRFGLQGDGPAALLAEGYDRYDYGSRRKVPARVRDAVKEQAGHRCENPFCDQPADTRLEIDHREALSAGGRDEAENMGALCGPCNNRKSRRSWSQFVADEGADERQRLGIAMRTIAFSLRVRRRLEDRTSPRPGEV